MNKKELKKWKKLALDFHNAYERLAPKFGYQTRKDTREFDPKSANGQLMTAVVRVVMQKQLTKAYEQGKRYGVLKFADSIEESYLDNYAEGIKKLAKQLLKEQNEKTK